MKYLLLLRGVNVGSKNRVRMDDLKQMLLELGFHKAVTYINSGNALFESDQDIEEVQDKIAAAFAPRFGFLCDMVIRTLDEMEAVVKDFPYSEQEITHAQEYDPEVEHLYVYFLNESVDKYLEKLQTGGKQPGGKQPEGKQSGQTQSEQPGEIIPDRIAAHEQEFYLLTHESVRVSKLALKLARICKKATARNWNTVTKLTGMLQEL